MKPVPHTPSHPRISVIIPTYGRPTLLEETLHSVQSQTYPAAEVIIVDDHSPEPVTIPDELRAGIRMLRHLRNQGPGAARNTGAAHATGDWVVFLDDDDLLTPHRLEWAVAGMGDARAHVCDIEWIHPDGRLEVPATRAFSGDMRDVFTHGSPPQLGQVVFRRSDLLQFDPGLRVSEDTEWWLRMADRAQFSWSPEIGLRYRWHSNVRPGLRTDTRLDARRQVAARHAARSDRQTRARLFGNVSGEALVAGRRATALVWAVRSLMARPTALGLKRLARGLVPLPREGATRERTALSTRT